MKSLDKIPTRKPAAEVAKEPEKDQLNTRNPN